MPVRARCSATARHRERESVCQMFDIFAVSSVQTAVEDGSLEDISDILAQYHAPALVDSHCVPDHGDHGDHGSRGSSWRYRSRDDSRASSPEVSSADDSS